MRTLCIILVFPIIVNIIPIVVFTAVKFYLLQ